ncbi:TPA: hypothetical protein N0F65_007740 [Lagenidium giganteum]|uniref:Uncharacterized protein n=1 Tax=Lagenidium giganteum TaxID=4803 RepID=A0AAV2Z004_9STRA|nr:TPA: hypothetical protein N0F65_007740 [Lagenidium giganteum]
MIRNNTEYVAILKANSKRQCLFVDSVKSQLSEIAIHSIQMYNSQFNIDSTAYGNNTFSIIVPTAATTSTIDITLNDGYYSYTDINRMIQTALVSAGAYLVDSNGNNVDLASVPTALPSGYTRPSTGLYSSGGSGLPSTAYTPQLVINNVEFGKVIGYSAGTYPNAQTTTAQSLLSDITPQVNPTTSYMLRCSLINNPYAVPSDVLTTFTTQGTTAGQLIDYKPNEYLWLPVSDGTYSSIQLIIVDQEERFCRFNDTNVLISIAIRKRL